MNTGPSDRKIILFLYLIAVSCVANLILDFLLVSRFIYQTAEYLLLFIAIWRKPKLVYFLKAFCI